ncbi:MAG: nucleotidyltransferase family protein, partial [Oscillospiraceae bacterium]|nr:nucleotidyltransferase family protein [Oscillospiraceae bacterium]
MKILGIVAEYNPFHNGHKLHIEESKNAISGDTAVVCVMSGDFVQRGEAAVFSKYARAEAAVRCGADLVIELPVPWSLSSAEGFARGSVGLLGALNCVSYLSFGSECGNIGVLSSLATAISDPSLDTEIREQLKSGISYAAARQTALRRSIGGLADHLDTPNNILAVEYLKAIYDQRLRIEPITIKRVGAGHDEEGGSASDLRGMLFQGKSTRHYVPKEADEVFRRESEQGRGPVFMDNLESAILSRLRMADDRFFSQIPDDSEGLGNRLIAAFHEEATLEGVLSAAKTKRYALSRLRRMSLCVALGIKRGQADGIPPYARILAANETGRAALKIIAEKSLIPLITKPAAVKELGEECVNLFALESSAHDLYALGYAAKEERRGNSDWRTS